MSLPDYVNVNDAHSSPAQQRDALEKFLAAEKQAVLSVRDRSQKLETGIALSGGGIRSAIFCLGALQALAAKGLLAKFDYMSSVSGGGYTSAALHWLWHTQPNTGTTAKDFPFGCEKKLLSSIVENRNLAYLRAHGSYLTPGDGLSIWTLTAVVIRTLFLNLIVWIPIGALLFSIFILLCRPLPNHLCFSVPNPLGFFIPGVWTDGTKPDNWRLEFFFALPIWGALFVIGTFFLWAVAFSLDTRISPRQALGQRTISKVLTAAIAFLGVAGIIWFAFKRDEPDQTSYGVLFSSIALVLVYWFMLFLQFGHLGTSANYRWRRAFETRAGWVLPWITIALCLGTVPILPYYLFDHPTSKAILGTIGALSGVISGAFGHRAQAQKSTPSNTARWLLMIGSIVFLYFIAVVSYVIAQILLDPLPVLGTDSQVQWIGGGIVLASFVVALTLAWRTNINYVGLHRFYRDRLMEAFMPDESCVTNNIVGRSPAADRLLLSELWSSDEKGRKRQIPYPIINTNAIMINDINREIAARGGDNFILSPLYVGSKVTGWEKTDRHSKKHGPQTLASAIAASGAALNANSAYVGSGITRDRAISILMTLLNLKLGIWVGCPSAKSPEDLGNFEPNHIVPSFSYGMTREGYKRDRPFIELSDGGHFDNLGIYELIRRRLQLILVLDGEEDAECTMAALYSVTQRIKEDFDTSIDLDDCLGSLVPRRSAGYPKGAKYVLAPYFQTTIRYPNNFTGSLIYVKLSLLKNIGFAAKGYRAQHSDFPHESTSNQFFVPEQIEAYRTVGFANTTTAIEGLGLDPNNF